MENYNAIWITIVAVLLTWFFTSCVTNGQLGEDGRNAIRTIARLEEQLSSIDRRIEDITTRAEDLEGNISLFEQSFRIYVDTVREMRAIIREYETKVERTTEQDEKTDFDPYDTTDLFRKY